MQVTYVRMTIQPNRPVDLDCDGIISAGERVRDTQGNAYDVTKRIIGKCLKSIKLDAYHVYLVIDVDAKQVSRLQACEAC